ncbi:hypothetical protein EDC04DRAFT_2601975 [Pisolithus marmoratus]|nr:hypothetical protein EDC04DRAFT_2601975 [Pisolithus marmoratus]
MELTLFGSYAPGGVESNISENQALTLKLTPALHDVEYGGRLMGGGGGVKPAANKDSMPTNVFTWEVMESTLTTYPPPHIFWVEYMEGVYPVQWLEYLQWQ